MIIVTTVRFIGLPRLVVLVRFGSLVLATALVGGPLHPKAFSFWPVVIDTTYFPHILPN